MSEQGKEKASVNEEGSKGVCQWTMEEGVCLWTREVGSVSVNKGGRECFNNKGGRECVNEQESKGISKGGRKEEVWVSEKNKQKSKK